MNQVSVRRHRCEGSVGSDGVPCVGSIDLPTTAIVDVRLEASVRVNALAAMARSDLRYHVVRQELRLLLSYVHAPHNCEVRLRRPQFRASALHIRRFVSESLGLAMLTAVTEWACGWRARRTAIANFDALPTNLVGNFAKAGVRPDLLFRLPSGDLAGEARGRSGPAPLQVTKEQRSRLDSMFRWSAKHGDHPFVMTWASITDDGTLVDLFEVHQRRPMPGSFRRADPLQRDVDARLANAFGVFYRDAPAGPATQRLFDRRVRGSWVPLDLVGPPDLQLFVGVMERPITLEEEEVRASRFVARPRDEPVEADLTGGLLIALARAGPPPPWREVERRFE